MSTKQQAVSSSLPTAVDNVRQSLARIGARDALVRAWTHLAPQTALDASTALDALPDAARGPLHGFTLGVKDVIDVVGMPTLHNSPLGNSAPAVADAPCVATLRAAGAVIIGKTDTTEFAAAGRNAATANPHDLERAPGGSSSGSAAAVADGHVRIALSTQTGGSTIRPASFCGIHAIKPTWGLISREGSKLYSNSLDTIGIYARSLSDLDHVCATFDFAPSESPVAERPRIGICRSPYWDRADADSHAALASAADGLRDAGCDIVDIELPPLFDRMEQAFMAILFREGAAAFLNLVRTAPELAHADFHTRVASRARYSDADLREAQDIAAEGRRLVESLMAGTDAVLTPSAPGVAPIGRTPGNPIFNQMWTLLHLPCINLPLFTATHGLPLGLTLIGPRYSDRHLLNVAERVETILGLGNALVV